MECYLSNKHRKGGTMNDMSIFEKNLNTINKETPKQTQPKLEVDLEDEEQKAINWHEVLDALQGTRIGKTFIPGDKKKAVDIASDILTRDYSFKTMFDTEELWFYVDGYYKPAGEAIIKDIIQKQTPMKESLTCPFITEIIESVKRKTFIEREKFEAPLNLLCLENGVFDLETNALIPHSPKYFFKNKIHIKYNPTAVCPSIDKFIETTLEEKYVALGYEIPAYCLYRHYFIQRAIMLTGTGQNGKSVFLDLIDTLLGRENCSSETLQSICNTTWGTAQMYGKLANICGDLPSVILEDTGEFKKLCSGLAGDYISAQQKFQNPFQFLNSAKLLFSANEVPESKDQTDAFFRRWVIIDFPYKFVSGLKEEEYGVFIRKENKGLIAELTKVEELEGFLFKVINTLRSLLVTKEFTNSPSVQEIRGRYNMKSNSAMVFIESFVTDEVLQEDGDKEPYVEKEFLLKDYKEWCKLMGVQARSDELFFKRIKDRWSPSTEKKTIGLGVRKACYVGIAYKPVWKVES